MNLLGIRSQLFPSALLDRVTEDPISISTSWENLASSYNDRVSKREVSNSKASLLLSQSLKVLKLSTWLETPKTIDAFLIDEPSSLIVVISHM